VRAVLHGTNAQEVHQAERGVAMIRGGKSTLKSRAKMLLT
jgi:hypothetical protein